MQSLKISRLTKHYNQPLLDNLSLTHAGDSRIALIGDNGCGKSTLLKILAAAENPDSGQIEWSQNPSIGYMAQEIADYDSLSGGQKKLAALAQLIYASSYDVLLLDEPDNHLDKEGKEWLMDALDSFHGLVIFISHDRNFLKKTADKVWLIEDHQIQTYPFGFDKFEQTYAQNVSSQEKLYKLQQAEKKRLEVFVDRMRQRAGDPKAARRYRSARSRLQRFVKDMVADPSKNTGTITIESKQVSKQISKKTAIFAKDLSFSYPDDEPVFQFCDLHLYINDKAALIAPNGAGKSTFIKLLLGQLKPTAGRAEIGGNLKVGYYSQEHFATLPANQSPLSLFMEKYPLQQWQAESILRKFFFTLSTMKARISLLSGGQRSRLQLALFLYKNPDVLILDEPTNHLDLKSILALEAFLIDFTGAILLISHDLELVSNVCSTIYTIQNKKITPQKPTSEVGF